METGWLKKIATEIMVFPLYVYRYILSPLKGGASCRFFPTCSEYAIQSLRAHGPLKGVFLILRRIIKCHPWHPGGYDPVPENFVLWRWRD